MQRILAVSTDPSLLYTRSLLLERTGASIKSAMPDQAWLTLKNCAFDLLVFCHTVSDQDIHHLSIAARASNPSIKILLIDSAAAHYHAALDVDHRFLLEDGPESLIKTSQTLLAELYLDHRNKLSANAQPVPSVPSTHHIRHKLPAIDNSGLRRGLTASEAKS